MQLSLTTRVVGALLLIDIGFNTLVPTAYLPLLRIEATGFVLGLDILLNVVRIFAWVTILIRMLKPVEVFIRLPEQQRTDSLLRKADAILQRTPVRFCLLYSILWGGQYAILTAYLVYFAPDAVPLSPRVMPGALLMAAAQVPGSYAFAYPLHAYLMSSEAGKLHSIARERGTYLDRPLVSLQARIAVLAMCLGLGPTAWIAAVGYMTAHDASLVDAQRRAEIVASDVLRRLERASESDRPPTTDAAAGVLKAASTPGTFVLLSRNDRFTGSPGAVEELELLPKLKDWALDSLGTDAANIDSHLERGAAVRHSANAGSVLVLARTTTETTTSFLATITMFAVIVLLWAPVCAILVSRSVALPLRKITELSRQIVNVGNLSEIRRVKVAQNDEVGILGESFNELLDLFMVLSRAARNVAKGELGVKIDAPGELPDAFREMAIALQRMVREIRETSIQLASAASELHAASQEQEAWATSQSAAMEEISRTASSLSDAAAHVAGAVNGVLGNAERTLETTETMASRIGELSTHAGRIGEILEVIREIADRSDLLALNGSLEASRAGDAGRGFALVAAEMRRLAERVTASVSDVQSLTADIRASGSSTMLVTEESKKLAESTTEAARQITLVTQQQQSGTEQVSQSVKNIAQVLSQAVAATTHTRTSAEDLKAHAERLADLVKRFQFSNEIA